MRISDWSSDVCSSDLTAGDLEPPGPGRARVVGDRAAGRPRVHARPGPHTLDRRAGGGADGGGAGDGRGHRGAETRLRGDEARKSVVEGKSVAVRVDLGGRRILKQTRNLKKSKN